MTAASKASKGRKGAPVVSPEVAGLLRWMATPEGVAGALRGEVEEPPSYLLAEVLSAFWLMLSPLFFGGKLPALPVVIVPDSGRLVCRWEAEASRVVIVRTVARFYPWALSRLLHEAVSVFCVAELCETDAAYHGHGPAYCDEANRIGRLLGVALVAPKGRGGMARAVDWPAKKPRRAGPAELREAATSAMLPVELREVEVLRAKLTDAERELAKLREAREWAAAAPVAPVVDAATRRVLLGCCSVVGHHVERVERARAAALAVSTHGGKAAAAREAVRLVSSVREELVALVGDDREALTALGVPS